MSLLWIVILPTLPLCFAVSQDQEKEGEEKIRDTIKQIEEEAGEESEEETEDEYDGDSCSGCQFFLPARFYLDLYNLNAALNGKLQLIHWTASLNYAIWRFSLGAGYNYSRFINSEYSGPSLKICFWL